MILPQTSSTSKSWLATHQSLSPHKHHNRPAHDPKLNLVCVEQYRMLAPIQHQLRHHSCATARQFSINLSQLVSALHRHSLTSWETKLFKLSAQFKCLLRFSRTRNATAKDKLYLVNHLFSAHLVVLLQVLIRP